MLPCSRSVQLLALGVMLGSLACNHSSTFVTENPLDDAAFGSVVPVRLTFDAGADLHPLWAADGSALLYTFERILPFMDYPDRCLGALPPDGGQRIHEWCWSAWNDASRRDGIEWGTLDQAGRMVFVHHYSAGDKQPLPFSGFLYQSTIPTFDTPQPLAELMIPHDGASAQWDYLTGPVFTAPDEVTALAMTIAVDVDCRECPFDTTWTGADLVRVTLQGTPRIERLAQLQRAAFLSWDASVGRFFFGRDGRIETLATQGGDVRFVWQVPRSPDRHDVSLRGVAAAAGRLVAAFDWRQDEVLHSVLGVVAADGAVLELHHDEDGVRWGEMSLSPDGRKLVVERRDGTERDLYLFELPE